MKNLHRKYLKFYLGFVFIFHTGLSIAKSSEFTIFASKYDSVEACIIDKMKGQNMGMGRIIRVECERVLSAASNTKITDSELKKIEVKLSNDFIKETQERENQAKKSSNKLSNIFAKPISSTKHSKYTLYVHNNNHFKIWNVIIGIKLVNGTTRLYSGTGSVEALHKGEVNYDLGKLKIKSWWLESATK